MKKVSRDLPDEGVANILVRDTWSCSAIFSGS